MQETRPKGKVELLEARLSQMEERLNRVELAVMHIAKDQARWLEEEIRKILNGGK